MGEDSHKCLPPELIAHVTAGCGARATGKTVVDLGVPRPVPAGQNDLGRGGTSPTCVRRMTER
ncbi:MAG: hypothetical protein ABI857_13015 [Acidobacteriota bacterium]